VFLSQTVSTLYIHNTNSQATASPLSPLLFNRERLSPPQQSVSCIRKYYTMSFPDDLLFFPPENRVGSSLPSTLSVSSSHRSQTSFGSHLAPPSISPSHWTRTPFGNDLSSSSTASISSSHRSQAPSDSHLAPPSTMSTSSSHQSQTSFSGYLDLPSTMSTNPSDWSQTPFGSQLTSPSTMSSNSSHRGQTPFASQFAPLSTMSISSSHQSQTLVARDLQAPSRQTASNDSTMGHHHPQTAHGKKPTVLVDPELDHFGTLFEGLTLLHLEKAQS